MSNRTREFDEKRDVSYTTVLKWTAAEKQAMTLAARKLGLRRSMYVRSLVMRELVAVDPTLVQATR